MGLGGGGRWGVENMGRDCWNFAHLRDSVETECSGNFLESKVLILQILQWGKYSGGGTGLHLFELLAQGVPWRSLKTLEDVRTFLKNGPYYQVLHLHSSLNIEQSTCFLLYPYILESLVQNVTLQPMETETWTQIHTQNLQPPQPVPPARCGGAMIA